MRKINKNIIKTIILSLLSFVFILTAQAYRFEGLKLNDNTLNLIHISDVHFDTKTKNSKTRMFEHSGELLKDTVAQVNAMKNVDLTIFSGDIINHSNENELLKFINIANNYKMPWLYAQGNHDIGIFGGISKSRMKFVLIQKNKAYASCCFNKTKFEGGNKALNYTYYPNKNFMIVFMDGVIDNKITANGYFSKEELNWLDSQLKSNPNKKIIIVQHYPVVEPFESASHKVLNADKYLKIIDKYNNIIAVLSGHYHSSKISQRKNVLHISAPALVEYPHAFREIKITNLEKITKFEIKLIETNLKNIQKISSGGSSVAASKKGKLTDINKEIIINISK